METAMEEDSKYHGLVQNLDEKIQDIQTINRDVILQLIDLDQKERSENPTVPPLVPSAKKLELDKLRQDGQKLQDELTTQQGIINDLLSNINKIQADENSVRDQLEAEKELIEQLTKQRDELRSILEQKGLIVPGETTLVAVSKSCPSISSQSSSTKTKESKVKPKLLKFLSNSEKCKKASPSIQNSQYSFGSRTERFS